MRTESVAAFPYSLTSLFVLALMFCELVLENLLCVRHSFHRRHGHLELMIASCADGDGGNGAYPFDYPQIAFRHEIIASETERRYLAAAPLLGAT
jgi:hypothetical protein